ncbi:putative hydrolase of the HAD superfamily [Shimia isoporae]|uniref:Putative hydrolase of the HAD superfamily n=1 Tax=Shimia isoporae TaxID=647720 RepID=A0A4R1NNG5_9RHOB|nr:HAD family hydrolase [Shimia isoporae]TCL08083.1 putative hydrolase of the HAD superfamily [Shimia isoporae]
MPQNLTTIAFDADDTLWHTERFFRLTQEHFADLLRDFVEPGHLEERLLEAERRNVGHYGFGVKGFVLSMIETAIEVTDEKVPATVIRDLMASGREMLQHPIDLLPHAAEVVEATAKTHRVLMITKGDLVDQERKLAQSGLGELFSWVEIVSHKTPDVYQAAFTRYGDGPDRAMMVGDSMRSDIVPAVAIGSYAAHVPHGLEWELEKADAPADTTKFRTLGDLGELPALISEIG